HGADRLALTALLTDLGRQVDDRPQCLQRHLRIELAQFAWVQAFEVLAQVNDTDTVHLFVIGVGADVDAVVEDDDIGAGCQPLGPRWWRRASSRHRLIRSCLGVGPGSMSTTKRRGFWRALSHTPGFWLATTIVPSPRGSRASPQSRSLSGNKRIASAGKAATRWRAARNSDVACLGSAMRVHSAGLGLLGCSVRTLLS